MTDELVLICYADALHIGIESDDEWPLKISLRQGSHIAIVNLDAGDALSLAGALLRAANEVQPHRPIIEGPPPEVT